MSVFRGGTDSVSSVSVPSLGDGVEVADAVVSSHHIHIPVHCGTPTPGPGLGHAAHAVPDVILDVVELGRHEDGPVEAATRHVDVPLDDGSCTVHPLLVPVRGERWFLVVVGREIRGYTGGVLSHASRKGLQ